MAFVQILIDDQRPHPDMKVIMRNSEYLQDSEYVLHEVNATELIDEQSLGQTKFTFRFLHRDVLGTMELGFVFIEDTQSAFLYIESKSIDVFLPFLVPFESGIPYAIAEAYAKITKLLENDPIQTPPRQ